jgi:intracellular sulfur oxidation DsrE/DsrF family protein
VFAFNDAIWAKYGKAIGEVVQFSDPMTKQAPASNLLNASDYGPALSNMGITIASVVKRGTQFAVCDMATNMVSGRVAASINANPQKIYKEFVSNLIPNSHLVAAGVVAVNRAQEYGYTLLTSI